MNATKCLLAASMMLACLDIAPPSPAQTADSTTKPLQQPASSATPSSSDTTSTVQQDIPYATVNGTVLKLDIYQPTNRSTQTVPGILLIHGGGWTSLDKSTMHNMGQFLARSGFVAFSVDYRLFTGPETRWPAQLDDVQRAVRWVRANAATYGVDPNRIGAFGHSAGAQLATLLGMEDTRNSDSALANYSSRVQAVVDVSGPTDFIALGPNAIPFFSSFLGADPAKHPEVWRDASPAFHAAKENAPTLIMHGARDREVPIAQAQELFDRMKAAHAAVGFITVDDEHTFQTPEARRKLAFETQAFFNRYLVVSR
jgi:acetyl esterase/lipase